MQSPSSSSLAKTLLNGLSTPTPTPPDHSPPQASGASLRDRQSISAFSSTSSSHTTMPSPPLASASAAPAPYTYGHTSSHPSSSSSHSHSHSSSHSNPHQQHPTLPPISTLQSAEPARKRSRVSSSSSTTSSNRVSPPEYPLSPYSTGSNRSPRTLYPAPASAHVNQGRLSVSSLLGGTPNEEDGDVKYRRMSAERSTR